MVVGMRRWKLSASQFFNKLSGVLTASLLSRSLRRRPALRHMERLEPDRAARRGRDALPLPHVQRGGGQGEAARLHFGRRASVASSGPWLPVAVDHFLAPPTVH